MNELENAITDRTKVLILNSPHNPTGKIFSRDELNQISDILKKYPNIVVLSDEVGSFNDNLTYSSCEHNFILLC